MDQCKNLEYTWKSTNNSWVYSITYKGILNEQRIPIHVFLSQPRKNMLTSTTMLIYGSVQKLRIHMEINQQFMGLFHNLERHTK